MTLPFFITAILGGAQSWNCLGWCIYFGITGVWGKFEWLFYGVDYKKGVEDIKNFRPTNLLGGAYRLLAKVLASRVKGVLDVFSFGWTLTSARAHTHTHTYLHTPICAYIIFKSFIEGSHSPYVNIVYYEEFIILKFIVVSFLPHYQQIRTPLSHILVYLFFPSLWILKVQLYVLALDASCNMVESCLNQLLNRRSIVPSDVYHENTLADSCGLPTLLRFLVLDDRMWTVAPIFCYAICAPVRCVIYFMLDLPFILH